jgi:hypothetical protein
MINMKEINLIGKTSGKLTVIRKGKTINKRIYWLCKCKCGKEKEIQGCHLRRKLTTSCGCSWYNRGKNSISWKGYGEIPQLLYSRINSNAKRRGVPMELSLKELWDLFLKQNRKCALSNLPLDFTYGRKNTRHYGTASLDRIDSSKGYIKGNVQWVHKDVNLMKQDYSNDYFLQMCKIIHEHSHA